MKNDHPDAGKEVILRRGNLVFIRTSFRLPDSRSRKEQDVKEYIVIYEGDPNVIGFEADHVTTIAFQQMPSLLAGLTALMNHFKIRKSL